MYAIHSWPIIDKPPSIKKDWPVINDAFSLHKNSIALATSLALPILEWSPGLNRPCFAGLSSVCSGCMIRIFPQIKQKLNKDR